MIKHKEGGFKALINQFYVHIVFDLKKIKRIVFIKKK